MNCGRVPGAGEASIRDAGSQLHREVATSAMSVRSDGRPIAGRVTRRCRIGSTSRRTQVNASVWRACEHTCTRRTSKRSAASPVPRSPP